MALVQRENNDANMPSVCIQTAIQLWNTSRKKETWNHSPCFLKVVELFQVLDQYNMILVPTHLPGVCNVTADTLPRLSKPSPIDWQLRQQNLLSLFFCLGEIIAAAQSKVTLIYISTHLDRKAWVVDILSISWDNLSLVYAFHPAQIIPDTLEKIGQSWGTTVIMVASESLSKHWHALFLQLSIWPQLSLGHVMLYQSLPHQRHTVFTQTQYCRT